MLDYGIVGDGVTNNTNAIRALTDKMAKKGGVLYFPEGKYLTGTIFLHSNMTLTVDPGATILGSNDFDEFPYIEGVEGFTREGHWGLISALDCKNITINGGGVIDARGEAWWKSGKSDLVRPRTISLIRCKNILITDINIYNSPCWTVHPICCESVVVERVKIQNPYQSPNTDGINPESCRNVRISNCLIDVGDDCVTIKSGTEDDLLQKQYPCQDITVSDCVMAHGHGGVVFGSEMSGGVKNVTVRNCVFKNTDRGIRIKTRRFRGGYVRGLNISNIRMDGVHACITFNTYYNCGQWSMPTEEIFSSEKKEVNDLTPVLENVKISNIKARNIKGVGIYMYGLPEMPVRNVTMEDIELDVIGNEKGFHAVLAFDRELVKGEGIFLENVAGVTMKNISLRCTREKLTVKNGNDVTLNGEDISK